MVGDPPPVSKDRSNRYNDNSRVGRWDGEGYGTFPTIVAINLHVKRKLATNAMYILENDSKDGRPRNQHTLQHEPCARR